MWGGAHMCSYCYVSLCRSVSESFARLVRIALIQTLVELTYAHGNHVLCPPIVRVWREAISYWVDEK